MPFVSLLSFLYYNIFCQKNQPLLYQYNCYYEKTGSEVKNITDEIPFDIPDSWCWVRLGKVLEIARGGSPRPIKEYLTTDNTGVNWIKIGDTEKGGKYINSTKEKIKQSGISKSRFVHKGDFLLTNSMSFGRPYILNIDGCIHDGWLVFSDTSDVYFKDFLYYVLSSSFANKQFAGKVSGAVVKNLNSDKVADSLFPLPPLAEQERIVAEIEKFEPLIVEYDKLEQQATKLDSEIYDKLKKSILQYAIQGKLVPQDSNDEPAAVLLERIRAEKKVQLGKKYVESYIYKGDDNCYYEHINGKNIDITEILPIDIPDNWAWVKLGDICFVTKLAGFEYTKYIATNLTTAGVPIFKGKNVQDGEIIYKFEGYIPEGISDMLERSQVRKKCILTPYVGTIGNLGIHNRNGHYHLGSNVGKIELLPYNITSEEYIVLYLKSIYGYGELTKNKKATAQESISIEAIREVYIPIPPLAEQKRIVDKIDEIFAKL